ncbi:IS66 family transposase [Plastorhodobacter daqingensis]|uniref:IS66 family transposase n=1 Tax=Plastorhodobacter daqingensis TaxID=1387281 RepID=A0ABW2UPW8_9RHOB
MRRAPASDRRGRHRGAGIRPRPLHREPHCPATAGLHLLRPLHPGTAAHAADRARPPRSGPARTCAGQQVCRSPATLSPEPDLDREGLDLDRSTLADWVGKSTALLETLAEAIGRHVLAAEAIFADDTPVRMLAPGTGKTQTARLWTYARDDRPRGGSPPPAAWYRFSGDRKGQHPKDHLAGFCGWMHADGYAGFEDLYRSGAIREVACMAHVRRKFVDIHRSQGSPIAEEAIARIARLYAVEKEARGAPPDRRAQLRRAHAAPVFDDLEVWLAMQITTISGKSPLAAAIRYALTRMERLRPYLDHGILELDNNAAERAMRAIALGRKNYLFAGSEAGGKAAAIAYTPIETAKLIGVDPQGWLADTLACIPNYKITRVDDLLPRN